MEYDYENGIAHCDCRILHAPKICEHCDHYPQFHRARELWGINFTGEHDPKKLPCPSEVSRSIENIDRWYGNVPRPADEKLEKVLVQMMNNGAERKAVWETIYKAAGRDTKWLK